MAGSSMISETLEFKTYYFEAYKNKYGLKGKECLNIFEKYKVFEYLNQFYDVLHTVSKEYVLEDIEIYIKARQK
jgi:hypothetical protein